MTNNFKNSQGKKVDKSTRSINKKRKRRKRKKRKKRRKRRKKNNEDDLTADRYLITLKIKGDLGQDPMSKKEEKKSNIVTGIDSYKNIKIIIKNNYIFKRILIDI